MTQTLQQPLTVLMQHRERDCTDREGECSDKDFTRPLYSLLSVSMLSWTADSSRVLPYLGSNACWDTHWHTLTFNGNKQVKTIYEYSLGYHYQPWETHINQSLVFSSHPNLIHQLCLHSFRRYRFLSFLSAGIWLCFHATFSFPSLNLTAQMMKLFITLRVSSCNLVHSTSYSTTSHFISCRSFFSIPLSHSLFSPQVQGHTCSYCTDIIKAPWKDSVKGEQKVLSERESLRSLNQWRWCLLYCPPSHGYGKHKYTHTHTHFFPVSYSAHSKNSQYPVGGFYTIYCMCPILKTEFKV